MEGERALKDSKKSNKKDGWVVAIGIFKVIKAALLIALGIGLTQLFHRDVSDALESWIRRLNVDTLNPVVQTFPEKVEKMGAGKLGLLCAGSFVYAGLFMTEGVGLLWQKTWAEYLTIIITASFLPYEIYEIVAKGSGTFKIVLLAGNVAILIYLIWRVVKDRRKRKA